MINLVAYPACGQGIPDQASSCPNCGAPFVLHRYKDKDCRDHPGFFRGFLGLHRFYLGQWRGLLYLLCAWAGLSW